MSSLARRMALALATLTLLTSLFMVAQGFLDAPEALASCPERTWCDPPYIVEKGWCCYSSNRIFAQSWQWCYWQEWDCTINSQLIYLGQGCFGSYCNFP